VKLLWVLLLWAPLNLCAQIAQPTPEDPVANKRAVQLAEQLRCLVCQNQSLADSNAELALDLRRQIREQIAQGRSNDEIVDFMVSRYGDFVLYRPPLKASTWLLWFGPPLVLLVGFVMLMRYVRERRKRIEREPLSASEHAEAELLLGSDREDERK
jgi:cytochrome c-type biogenesis protein CcmH